MRTLELIFVGVFGLCIMLPTVSILKEFDNLLMIVGLCFLGGAVLLYNKQKKSKP